MELYEGNKRQSKSDQPTLIYCTSTSMTNHDQPTLNPQTSSIRSDPKRRARKSLLGGATAPEAIDRKVIVKMEQGRTRPPAASSTNPQKQEAASKSTQKPQISLTRSSCAWIEKLEMSSAESHLIVRHWSLSTPKTSVHPQSCAVLAVLDFLLTEDRPDEINDCGMGI